MKQTIHIRVNGDDYAVAVNPWETLLDVLRNSLRLTGTKRGCGDGDCGACTVLLAGRPVNSCLTLAVETDGREILTIEGVARSGTELHPIQQAFVDQGAVQCGYCTPGMVLAAWALLLENPDPSEEEIRRGIDGNLCRCTGYAKIVEAIAAAAEILRREGT